MMKEKTATIGILAALGIGSVCAMLSFSHHTLAKLSDVYPEYASLDSAYIEARGFPFPQWAVNDPNISGVGDVKSAVLWSGFLINWGLYTIGIGILGIPVLIVSGMCWWYVRNARGKTTANHTSDGIRQPEDGSSKPSS